MVRKPCYGEYLAQVWCAVHASLPFGHAQLTVGARAPSRCPIKSVRKVCNPMDKFMDEGAKSYLFKYASRNHWRVAAWIDFDDLIQEGYAAYYDTLRRYPAAIEPSHIMSLYKLVLRSTIENLVRQHSKQIDDARSDIIEIYDGDAILMPDGFALQSLLLKAPKPVKDVLALFSDDNKRKELQKPYVMKENGRRETMNERLCRLIGYDPDTINLAKDLRMWISQGV